MGLGDLITEQRKHLRFWRRHPKGKSVGMEGLEAIILGTSGPKVKNQRGLTIAVF